MMSTTGRISKSIKQMGTFHVVSKRFRSYTVGTCNLNQAALQLIPQQALPFTNRTYSTSHRVQNSSNGITSSITTALSNLHSRYSIKSQQNRVILASSLFESIKHQAYNSQWYIESPSDDDYKIKPEFRQIHAMLSMHMWFIHRRLLAENKRLSDNSTKKNDNLLLQEELFELFWTDTTSRIRAQEGIIEMTVNKHLKDAQRATFVHVTQYDHAFESYPNDVEKRFEIICDAVWKHVLGGEEDSNEDLIRKIGAYVEYQLANVVLKLPDDYFVEGRIAWGNIPNLSSGVDLGDIDKLNEKDRDEKRLSGPLRGMTFLRDNWVQVLSVAGKPYYWNMDTNQTSWEKP